MGTPIYGNPHMFSRFIAAIVHQGYLLDVQVGHIWKMMDVGDLNRCLDGVQPAVAGVLWKKLENRLEFSVGTWEWRGKNQLQHISTQKLSKKTGVM